MYEYTEWVLSKSMFIFLGSHSACNVCSAEAGVGTGSVLENSSALLHAANCGCNPQAFPSRNFGRGSTLSLRCLWDFFSITITHEVIMCFYGMRQFEISVLWETLLDVGNTVTTWKQILKVLPQQPSESGKTRYRIHHWSRFTINLWWIFVASDRRCRDTAQHIVCYLW